MPKILQINLSLNVGSHGRIVNEIGEAIIAEGWESHVAYGRSRSNSSSTAHKIGSRVDQGLHVLLTRLFHKHGSGSRQATKRLGVLIRQLQPDIVHLHLVHGYYLHLVELMKILKDWNKPVVWTFHDAWPLTGHCCYFTRFNCQKWQATCHQCPLIRYYPQSWGVDNSTSNHQKKKEFIGALEHLHIVPVSHWLEGVVGSSYLKGKPITVIQNGVDTEIFRPSTEQNIGDVGVAGQKIYLGAASIWSDLKGLSDFVSMAALLNEDERIVLIGLSNKQSKGLPRNITAIPRTRSLEELRGWYSRASVFLNPSKAESFGLVTAEALACGTPAVVYNTTACPELVDEQTGRVVPLRDYREMLAAARELASMESHTLQTNCVARARTHFDKKKQTLKYIQLYRQLLQADYL